jgi:carboxyl-terminal processing protease
MLNIPFSGRGSIIFHGIMLIENLIYMRKIFFLVTFLASFFFSCNKDVNDDGDNDSDDTDTTSVTTDTTNLMINRWILEEMQTYYLWENKLPEVTDIPSTDPEAFFDNLLYTDLDKWSFITDDYEALSSELEGTPTTMGYSPAFYLYNSSKNVLIVVEYVYPNSPAETAGLKRGDIILTINGEKMDTTNYYDLYSASSYTVKLGSYSSATGSLSYNGTELSMIATQIDADPSIYHSVIDYGGMKTGYLVYTEFVSGTSDKYLSTLDDIFDEFKASGISNLIVDLRYNPGGGIDCAGYLASAIAPSNVVSGNNVLENMDYNELLDYYFLYFEGKNSENLIFRFPDNSHNINLSTVYFLTTSGTASACELLISGLRPYMNSIIIGESTYGKYTGAFVLSDYNDPPQHNWAIIPIVLKYSNADGYSDFVDGLTPDYEMTDELIGAAPFGDISDPMVAKALEVITGQTTVALSKSARLSGKYKRLIADRQIIRKNLFVDKSEQFKNSNFKSLMKVKVNN